MSNPITSLTKKECRVWIGSLCIIIISNLLSGNFDLLTLVAASIGVTSLIFAAKGNVWSQILMIIFSILYSIISWQFRYWGEMMTYLGMTMPMAIWSTITWIRNPSASGKEVEIQKLTPKHVFLLIISGTAVTALFFAILDALNTPNITFSTISVTTSFFAASLTMLRSSYYALGYASNDIVLIVLWILASIRDPRYLSVTIIFIIFFFYDIYGFISWKKRESSCG
ncbi:nicotinamide riboside transporter PnuC [Clostridium sp. MSJ-8]|uniref:nicotinamide riboside transporter PnuC n=1 Tax=Clostridium sp. MSJ-8 TaxID=2841510 RepID=UPI001C0E98D1|nr:nicotinamide riboside transporter PnuC [Clostridium sp. MSJ-8]MBU5486583.1 nicotinamide riboside transporter PnuC [Clostridium sp. MSJ-8]